MDVRRPLARNEVIPSAATPPRDFSALALFSHDVPDPAPLADPPAEQYSRGPTNKDLSYEIRGRGSGIRRTRRGYVTGYFSGGGGGAIACTPKHSAVTRKSGKLVLPPLFPDCFGRNLGGDYGSKITQPRADLTSVREGRDKIGSPTHTHTRGAHINTKTPAAARSAGKARALLRGGNYYNWQL